MAELMEGSGTFTTDSDFRYCRKNGPQAIPLLIP
jgi:hypothetical protein